MFGGGGGFYFNEKRVFGRNGGEERNAFGTRVDWKEIRKDNTKINGTRRRK